jgi:hypothetical protein
MANEIIVHKARRNVLTVGMGYDVSDDTITSEIRAAPVNTSPLIATWAVTFATDGSDGELILTLDDTATGAIDVDRGYMDLKRMTGGEPVPVFDKPIEVIFQGTVTV